MGAGSTKISKRAEEPTKEEVLKYDLPSGTPYWTTKADGEAIVQYAARGWASKERCPSTTLHSVFIEAVKKRGNKIACLVEPPMALVDGKAPPALPLDQWKKWTYQQYYEEIRAAAKGFIKLGFAPHDSVCPYGFNSPQWFMSQWAAQFAGGKVAGIYPSDTAPQVQFKAFHSNASIATCESEKEFKKFQTIADELPYLKAVVCWAYDKGANITRSDGSVIRVITWDELIKLGQTLEEKDLDERIANQRPGHCCALIYTSGTTGNPKAVMISHDNLVSEIYAVLFDGMRFVATKPEAERIISYLPLSHVAGMMVDICTPVFMTAFRTGWCEVYFARPYDLKAGSLGDRLRTVKPTIFLGVPRVWEKIAEKMKAVGAKTKGIKKKIATWAKAKGLAYQRNCQIGGSGKKPFNYGLADKLALSKVKAALGLEFCKFGFTGAAPISYETQSYFGSLGININEVYGMSECTGATTWSTDTCHQWGSVGYALPGQEVKIFKIDDKGNKVECPRAKDITKITELEQGEICFRGRHIMMGYLANPKLGSDHVLEIQKKNQESLDSEGWLHSGDKGCMSELGMIRVTGRYKELIKGAGGENIAPVPIEDNVKALCPAISNFQMIGDKRKFNVALVSLKAVGATGESAGTGDLDKSVLPYVSDGVTTIEAAAKDPKLIQIITKAIEDTNKDGKVCPSSAAAIQKFTIIPRDFSVETGDLTATLKLKRSVTEEKHLKQIDLMYEAKDVYVPYAGLVNGDYTSPSNRSSTPKKSKGAEEKQSLLANVAQ